MSIRIAWCSACIFAMTFYTLPKPSQNQVCSTEKMENTTIDIKAAFSKGIRGEDPIHASSWEACVDVCCLGADSKKCNYVVFNTRSKGNYTNCYLFYYPTNETCPVRHVSGLVSYRMIKDAQVPMPTPTSVQLSHPTVNGKSVSALAAMFNPHIPASPLLGSGPLQKPIPPKSVEILNHLDDKHVDEMDGDSQHPQSRRANGSKSLGSSTMPELKSLLSPSTPNTIEPGIPTAQPPVKSPTITNGTQAGTIIPHVSPRNATTTRSTTAYYKNAPWATTNLRSTTTVPNPSSTAGSSARNLSPLLMKISSASLHDVHLGNGQQGLKGDMLNGDPSREHFPPFGDKSILTAALLLGVIFFLLVTVLVELFHNELCLKKFTENIQNIEIQSIRNTNIQNATRSRKLYKWMLDGKPIEQVQKFQYLGVHFQHNMGWKAHIAYLQNKAKALSNALLRFFFSEGALHVPSALKVFKAKVVATMAYAAPLWGASVNLAPLETIQNQFLRRLLKLPQCVSNAAIRLELKIPSLENSLWKHIFCYWLSLWHRLPNLHLIQCLWRDDFVSPWAKKIHSKIMSYGLFPSDLLKLDLPSAKRTIIQKLDNYDFHQNIITGGGTCSPLNQGIQPTHQIPSYLSFLSVAAHRFAFTKARFNVFPSNVLGHRFSKGQISVLCTCDNRTIESLYHILFCCPLHTPARTKILYPLILEITDKPLETQLTYLLQDDDTTKTLLVARYLISVLSYKKQHNLLYDY